MISSTSDALAPLEDMFDLVDRFLKAHGITEDRAYVTRSKEGVLVAYQNKSKRPGLLAYQALISLSSDNREVGRPIFLVAFKSEQFDQVYEMNYSAHSMLKMLLNMRSIAWHQSDFQYERVRVLGKSEG